VAAARVHPLERRHVQITALTIQANAIGKAGAKARRKVLGLVPQGVYRDYEKREYYVLGIEHDLQTRNFWVCATERVRSDERLILKWKLVKNGGDQKGWFQPVSKGSDLVPRFTLVRAISLSDMLARAMR
jgi:hypothetical protein